MTIEFLWDKNSSCLMGLYRKQKTLKNSDYFSYLFSKIMTILFIFLINKYSNPPSNAVVRGFCYEFKHLSFFCFWYLLYMWLTIVLSMRRHKNGVKFHLILYSYSIVVSSYIYKPPSNIEISANLGMLRKQKNKSTVKIKSFLIVVLDNRNRSHSWCVVILLFTKGGLLFKGVLTNTHKVRKTRSLKLQSFREHPKLKCALGEVSSAFQERTEHL